MAIRSIASDTSLTLSLGMMRNCHTKPLGCHVTEPLHDKIDFAVDLGCRLRVTVVTTVTSSPPRKPPAVAVTVKSTTESELLTKRVLGGCDACDAPGVSPGFPKVASSSYTIRITIDLPDLQDDSDCCK